MSHVELFSTRIKIESSDQSPFLRADQAIKVTSKLWKSKDQECMAPNWPLSCKEIKWSGAFKGTIKWSSTLFAKDLDASCKRFNRWHTSNHPLNNNFLPLASFTFSKANHKITFWLGDNWVSAQAMCLYSQPTQAHNPVRGDLHLVTTAYLIIRWNTVVAKGHVFSPDQS